MTYKGVSPRDDDQAPRHLFESRGGDATLVITRNYYIGRFDATQENHQADKYYIQIYNQAEDASIALSDLDMEELFRAWLDLKEHLRENP